MDYLVKLWIQFSCSYDQEGGRGVKGGWKEEILFQRKKERERELIFFHSIGITHHKLYKSHIAL